jgi:hypothetical protein
MVVIPEDETASGRSSWERGRQVLTPFHIAGRATKQANSRMSWIKNVVLDFGALDVAVALMFAIWYARKGIR